MATIKIRYFKWRDGRPRWEPGPTVRALGFKGQNLKDAQGRWLSMPAAIAAAEALNKELDAFRLGAPKKQPRATTSRTVNALFQHYFASNTFADLREKTRQDYLLFAKPFLELFGDAPVSAVDKPLIFEFYNSQRQRGTTAAARLLSTVRLVFSYAELIGWREAGTNPAKQLKIKQPLPRQVLWLPDEISLMIETAEKMQLHSIGDAIIMAIHLGQRPADIRAMPDKSWPGGRIIFTQQKKGKKVDIPISPIVQKRMTDIRQRKARQKVTSLEALIIYEGTGRPYSKSLLPKKFSLVRKEAAKTKPAIKEKTFQDFRDTSVTRLAQAGCTTTQIRSITGHSEKTVTHIIEHYLILTADMADKAEAKLRIWLKEEGIEA